MPPAALLDTCVLFPAYLRDTLLCIAEEGLFRPRWSADILDEFGRNLLKLDVSASLVDRVVSATNTHFDDALVEEYDALIPTMVCDNKDRQVLAAAVHGSADVLVTFNVRDFPLASMATYEIALATPDDFLLDLFDLAPAVVLTTLRDQAARYKREPKTISGLLAALARAGAPRFADEIRRLVR